MATDAVTADYDEFLPTVVGERQRSAERLPRFRHRLRRAETPPKVLSRGRINRKQEGLIAGRLATAPHRDVALQHLHHEPPVVEQRAGRERPLKRKRPDVPLPKFATRDFKRHEVASTEEKEDKFAVGNGRW